MLAYLCKSYFAGETDKLKEYCIAVDVLGRNHDFDPSADTIVRVEASRLRKRLKEYYEGAGSNSPIRLQLAKPGYVPQFEYLAGPTENGANGTQASGSLETSAPVTATAEEREAPSRIAKKRGPIAAYAAAAVLATAILFLIWMNARPSSAGREAPRNSAISPAARGGVKPMASGASEIRLLAGLTRSGFIDSQGHAWSPDQYFTGGIATETIGEDVIGVLDSTLYRTARQGDFKYDIPLEPGTYQLRLLFIENYYGKGNRISSGESSRVFAVSINGVPRVPHLDILSDSGAADVPADRVFRDISPTGDGFLHLSFQSVMHRASLSGIEIVPSSPGRMRPVRIVAGGRTYVDRSGQVWEADRYFIGGRPQTVRVVNQGTGDPELYENERWGHFSYSIPVPPEGRYKATLRFAEDYYGTSYRRPAIGARVFNVFCNGVALLRDFDVLKEAGGENRALDKIFRGLRPTAQGRLTFDFVPVQDYASVKAIEVVDDGS
jgi:hypothetical protein